MADPAEDTATDVPPHPDDALLRHGYTRRDLARLTNYTVAHYRFAAPMGWEERREIACSAIAEHLCAAGDAPSRYDLIRAGWSALTEHTRKARSFHGRTPDGAAPGFQRYWMLASAPVGSPETRIVERTALVQIWAVLSERHRELLLALAHHGDYADAATSLGLTKAGYYSLISRARRAFFTLWHEHETPTRAWGNDVRSGRPRHKHVTTTAIRQRTRTRAQRPAPGTGYRARRDIGITDAQLRDRYDNGATITELAREYGMRWASIQNRITNPKS